MEAFSLPLSTGNKVCFPYEGSLKAIKGNAYTAYLNREERTREVNESMAYSRRLQNGMMSQEKLLHEIFPEAFLLDIPKHIVSGDFYWLTKVDEKVIIAVGDCTGHGIPGAMMSVLGISLLNQLVLEERNTDPSFILQRLNEKVKRSFENSGHTHDDGMDISLCCIDYSAQTLVFAGALRPIYLMSQEGITIVKGSRYPIGCFNITDERVYENQVFSFDKGNTLYLFTDGYADQFGGPMKKKLTGRNFRVILKDIHTFSMEDQKGILQQILNSWKGNDEQTDDIMVLGIKF